jgi:hypothetical protein
MSTEIRTVPRVPFLFASSTQSSGPYCVLASGDRRWPSSPCTAVARVGRARLP